MLFGFQNANRMFNDIAEGKTVKYFGLLEIMLHDAKSGSHLNGEVYS